MFGFLKKAAVIAVGFIAPTLTQAQETETPRQGLQFDVVPNFDPLQGPPGLSPLQTPEEFFETPNGQRMLEGLGPEFNQGLQNGQLIRPQQRPETSPSTQSLPDITWQTDIYTPVMGGVLQDQRDACDQPMNSRPTMLACFGQHAQTMGYFATQSVLTIARTGLTEETQLVEASCAPVMERIAGNAEQAIDLHGGRVDACLEAIHYATFEGESFHAGQIDLGAYQGNQSVIRAMTEINTVSQNLRALDKNGPAFQ